MKPFVIIAVVVLTSISLSTLTIAKNNIETVPETPLITHKEKNALTSIHSELNIVSISDRLKNKESLRSEVNKRLSTFKTSEQKLSFVISLNKSLNGNFHINDDYYLELNNSDKSYFDAYYAKTLINLNNEIKENPNNIKQLINQCEKNFPFKIYINDLLKIQEIQE